MIAADGITKAYGGTIVVDGVSLTIPARGITAIIGPNGAGKSTLLGTISRLLPMNAGTVTVDGLDVTRTAGEVLAKRLAILRQDNQVAARLTVADLVAFGRYPHSRGRLTVADRQAIEEAVDILDLGELRGRFLDELSGGQRQRAFVAMVLAQATDYVLLDEPLNNLDIKHAVGMMTLLRRAASEFGKTVVVVLHDINFAAVHADRIVCMKAGRIAFDGTPAEVITPAVLREIYEIDVAVHDIGGKPISIHYGQERAP